VQNVPHWPQLFASDCVSTHVPPQSVCPTGQTHFPPTQLAPVGQTLPHAPQLLVVFRSVQ